MTNDLALRAETQMTFDIRTWILGAVAIGAAWGPSGAPLTASAPSTTRPAVVVELFTSEGCSSCPPADTVLSQLAREARTDVEVLAIGEHVDYWDRLGWHDRFSSTEFSARQSIYDADALHLGEVYTPQMVIDGRFSRVGTDTDGIRRDIRSAALAEKGLVTVAVAESDGVLHVDVGAQVADANRSTGLVDLVVAATEDNLLTNVRAGENRGRALRHDGVARWMRSVAAFSPGERMKAVRVEVPLAADWNRAHVRVIGFLQERDSRRIIGAGAARLPN